jgi:hypothetical protein
MKTLTEDRVDENADIFVLIRDADLLVLPETFRPSQTARRKSARHPRNSISTSTFSTYRLRSGDHRSR